MDGAGALAIGMPVLSLLAGSRPGSRPTFLLLPECRPQDSRPRTGPYCPRPRSHAAGQPVSWHLRGAPQNSTSRPQGRYARTTAASQMTKWLCPAAQPPPRKHHATGAATRGWERVPLGPSLRSACSTAACFIKAHGLLKAPSYPVIFK